MEHYNGLNELLASDEQAHQIYAGLPPYIQETIMQKKDYIASRIELERFAENLMQGDC